MRLMAAIPNATAAIFGYLKTATPKPNKVKSIIVVLMAICVFINYFFK